MVISGIALILGSIVWFIQSDSSTADLSTEISPPVSSPQIPYPDIQRIRVGDAKAALDLGSAIFIDVRGEPYFSQGHIPGALSITEDELLNRLQEFKPTDWIILYCT